MQSQRERRQDRQLTAACAITLTDACLPDAPLPDPAWPLWG